MADFATDYKGFLAEFETLTEERVATLKNKGKEEGIKKLKMLFKTGKTLDARCADYDAAITAANLMANLFQKNKSSAAIELFKKAEVAYDKMNEGLKLNIKDFEAQLAKLGDPDKKLKSGLEVFANRLEQLRKRGKMDVEIKRRELTTLTKAPQDDDHGDKLRSGIKVVYLTIGKGIAETEAVMKMFIAKPSEETMMKAFSSSSGPRTLSTSVTNWAHFVLKQDPTVAGKLGGADPATLLVHIIELTKVHPVAVWRNRLQMDKDGWEDRGKAVATHCLAQLSNWRTLAGRIKALND